MKKLTAFIIGCILFTFAVDAMARPKEGVGIFIGVADHSSETSLSGTNLSYDSDGTSFGVDIQIPLGDSTSFNLFFMDSSEDSKLFNEVFIANATVANFILGAQLRWWPTDLFFLGLHAGIYGQEIESTFAPEEGDGFGYGFAFGIETEVTEKILFFAGGQFDTVPGMDVLDGFSDTEMSGSRFHAGIRIIMGN